MKGRHANSLANLASGRKSPKRPRRFTYAELAAITERMMARRFTIRQIQLLMGISKTSASNWTHALHDAGCIHISEYARTRRNGHGAAIYQWGSGDDTPYPETMSDAERARRSRGRKHTLDGAWRMPPNARPQLPAASGVPETVDTVRGRAS